MLLPNAINDGTNTPACISSCSRDYDYGDQPLTEAERLAAALRPIDELEMHVTTDVIERFTLERFSTNPKLIKF